MEGLSGGLLFSEGIHFALCQPCSYHGFAWASGVVVEAAPSLVFGDLVNNWVVGRLSIADIVGLCRNLPVVLLGSGALLLICMGLTP